MRSVDTLPSPEERGWIWGERSRSLRWIAGGLAVIMSVSLMEGVAAAVPPEAPAQEPKAGSMTAAADIPSAKVAAKLSGHRVEALSERTETSTTWVNQDGSLTTELSAGPVRFQRDGDWVDVDVDLRESGDGVAPVAHPGRLRLAGRTGRPAASLKAAQRTAAVDLVTLGEGDERITLQWKGGLPKPTLKGARAEYADAVPGADVVVEATRTGFEQYVEIKQRPTTADYTYTLPLKAEGLKAKQLEDGSVLFTDRKNRKRAVMPAPVMWDSTVDERSGEHLNRARVDMRVVQTKDGVDLVVSPDREFLADPDTRYPVTVDPSTSSLSSVFDTYVQQGETVDWSGDVELDFGNPGTKNADGTPRTAQSFRVRLRHGHHGHRHRDRCPVRRCHRAGRADPAVGDRARGERRHPDRRRRLPLRRAGPAPPVLGPADRPAVSRRSTPTTKAASRGWRRPESCRTPSPTATPAPARPRARACCSRSPAPPSSRVRPTPSRAPRPPASSTAFR
ncbi:hypothetical protein SGLAM104S_03149 [Streptomyces glaucescens]